MKKIRKVTLKDREAICNVIQNARAFTPEEEQCAIELLDIYLKDHSQKDYEFLCYIDDCETPVGYVCYGHAPFTHGVYYIYWIAVDPLWQSKGVGQVLMKELESLIIEKDGRMLLIETASKPSYEKTRTFYLKQHYTEFSRIKNFYCKNDDRITYGKLFAK
ncbi:MAG: GNAT family N-acetyltransferase [Candidatus Ancaeobacter aquaticus]|nr:GNAT family N-acetyltransferase [Candidatus Ancaeobacter aquaticus]